MKRKFTKLMAALALLTFLAVPMGMWGQETHTIGWGYANGDPGTYTNFTATSGAVTNILSFTTAKNSANNAPAYNSSNKELRLYNASNGDGCSITITPESGLTITQIVITATSGYTSDVKYSVDGGTATAASWSNNTCTISNIEASTSLMVQNVKTSTQQLRIRTIAVTYAANGPVTYTVTYDCNGGTNGCPENLTGLSANTPITLANAPTKEHFNFEGWSDGTTTYNAGDSYTVNSNVTFTAQWEPDGTYGEGSICFSNQSNCTAINSQSVTGNDDLGNTWTITTEGTSSFIANSGYYQVGSGNSPASSITFTTTLDEEVNVTSFSAAFGGFNATQASVVLKVDNTQVGTGSLNGSADVTVSNTSAQTGTTLTVIVTPTAGGVKCYNISYTYETITPSSSVATPTFSPAAGTYTEVQNVTISCATTGAEIHYTLDGTTPDATSDLYSDPINIATTTTVKAIAVLGGESSAVATATYTINLPSVATPTFSPAAGTYTETQNVTISTTTADATIYYTTDGTDPTTYSSLYSSPIAVSTTTTVKAMAVKAGMNNSEVATATYAILEHAGTEADPYTVADARAAIDAGTGVTGVYATGIVSEIVEAYNTQYHNISYNISTDGTTASDQLECFRGKSYNGANFTSADDIQVGATVVVYGNLTKYNDTYEFAANNQLVSYTAPVVTTPTITVSPTTVNATYASSEGTLNVTYQNITTVVAEVVFCDVNGDAQSYNWIDAEIDNNNNVYYTINANTGAARTAYLKVHAFEDELNNVYSELVTINQAQYVVDYATLPFEWSDFSSTPTGITNYSVGSYTSSPYFLKFDGTGDYIILKFNEAPGSLTFDIYGNSFSGGTFKVQTSVDGQTYTDLTSYTSLSSNTLSESFNNLSADVRYIKWIYTEKSSGNVALGNITLAAYTAPTPTITLNSYEINAPAAATDGTLTVTYTEIETGVGVDIIWCDENGDALTDQTEYESWLLAVFVTGDNNTIEYTIEANDGAARTAYFKVYGVDGGANDVYSNLVTIAQAASGPAPATYTLINNVNNLVSGKRYIIASGADGSIKAMGTQNTNNRAAVAVSSANGVIPETTDVFEFVIIGPDVEGFYTIYDVTKDGYLYAAGSGSGNNHLKNQKPNDDNGRWTIAIAETGAATIVAQGSNTNKYMRFNNTLFSCYGAGSSVTALPYLYAKDGENPVQYSKNDIAGYGSSERGGYYLIASPVGQVTPAAGNGFLTNNYDLYAFDQSASNAKVWRNYEATNFNLVSGRGYLYANSGTTTELTFEGMPYVGNGQVILSYDDNSDWAGWNLIGNPYATNATIPNNQSYYTLNTDRDELIAGESTTIGAMEGIFVKATAAGQSVTFTPTRGNKGEANLNSRVVLNLNGDHGVIDRAIVRFSEGGVLPKFMMNPENTRIYIRQGNEDFAVLNSEAQGEMPVNFKAATDGTYTISVEAENLDVNYLHLIDNKTGMDIDLLQTPSYTFKGKRTDYASRFRLVFSANNVEDNNGNEMFAFISDGNIIISGAQNATVQVVDMLGRVVVSRNNVNTLSTEGIVPGVYVIRVIDGENVRAQKIVVR